MSCLHYQDNELYIEKVSLNHIAAEYGTPCYVYSRAAFISNYQAFAAAFRAHPHRICYAVKANSNLALLHILARYHAGFDIVSLGELERVLAAGGDASRIVFSGVGKKKSEIEQAINKGVYCFNVESEAELERLNSIAATLLTTINIALRVNPNVDAKTHNYISTGLSENKFGIDHNEVLCLCKKMATFPSLRLIGIASHIGSQITDLEPFATALDRLLTLYQQITALGITLAHINIGGGLGITYRDEQPPTIAAYAKTILDKLAAFPGEIIIEPGRSLVGNTGILLTRIEYLKHGAHRHFAIVDAGMNDLLRPALYEAWQAILPVQLRHHEKKIYDVVGPVCESADFLGKNRELAIESGDLLAVDAAGAYGFSMSSNYNSRCRPAEILVVGETAHIIRRRETINELFAAENLQVDVPLS